jgi:uncharacterized protein (TIGR00251 family)
LIRATSDGIELQVRVVPRAGRSACAGVREGALLIRLAAPPVEGAANDALIAFLSQQLDVPRRNIRIVAGEKSRTKRVAIAGISATEAEAALGV